MTKIMGKQKLSSYLEKIHTAGWRDSADYISQLVIDLDEKTFDEVFFKDEVWGSLFETSQLGSWIEDRILTSVILKYRHRSDDILKESNVGLLKQIIISKGLYSDIAVLDQIARTSTGPEQEVAAHYCSVEALRDIKEAKSAKVRKIVFQRLGPVECLDIMLKDKKADIREEGVRMAPFGYEMLNDMTKEIARGPFSELVGKISSEYLPMLLANRNLKNKWISNKLQSRLITEENNDV